MAINAGPPDDSYDSNVEYLIDTLPGFMANDEDSGNWHLLSPIGEEINRLENELEAVDRAASVQEADTIDQLDKLGKMVNKSHRAGEGKEHYRSRLFARFQLNTAEGTIGDIIHSVSTILDVEPEKIGYQDLDNTSTEATIGVVMPRSAVNSLNLSSGEIANILHDLVPAGYEVEGQTRGTFLYVTPTTYENTSDWSTYDGYDGLDSNGDPKETGGTYAGIVN